MKTVVVDSRGEFAGIVADSAMAYSRRPWFVPDFGSDWRGRIMAVFRISRLGKGIGVKFAGRYFDSVSVAVRPEADSMVPGAAEIMDGAVIAGDWMPVGNADDVRISLAGRDMIIDNVWSGIDIAGIINRLSDFATFKTGDVIAVALPVEPLPLKIGDKFEAVSGEASLLKFSIR